MSVHRRVISPEQVERGWEQAMLSKWKEDLLDRCVREDGPIENSPCWIWTSTVWGGYGRVFFGRHSEATHRASYMIHIGPIPEGMWCLHKCDAKLCCEASHLWLGTSQDNVDDMMRKGRNRGYVRNLKLTEADILEIRERAARGESNASIARGFGLHHSWVAAIVRGEAYEAIGGPRTIINRPKTSRFVGVYWQKSDNRWMSRIKIDGTTYFLGNFTDEVAAGRAFNDAVIAHNLNRSLNVIPELAPSWRRF